MKARLKTNVVIQDQAADWVTAGREYEAEWSEKMTSPKRVLLIHPERPDLFVELPFHSVEILPD